MAFMSEYKWQIAKGPLAAPWAACPKSQAYAHGHSSTAILGVINLPPHLLASPPQISVSYLEVQQKETSGVNCIQSRCTKLIH